MQMNNIFPGNYLKYVGSDETLRVSEATVSRCIDSFVAAMAPHYSDIIRFPMKPDEVAKTQKEFFTIEGYYINELHLLSNKYATFSNF